MKPQRNSFRLFLASLMLTLVALLGQPYLPERVLALRAEAKGAEFFLMPNSPAAVNSRIEWVDRSHLHFRCEIAAGDTQSSCSLSFVLPGATTNRGIDVGAFDALRMKIAYQGNAKYVRVAIRNFDPRFSKAGDGNSAKFNNVSLPVRDLGRPLRVALSEFTVPEWWVSTYDLPREYTHPDFGNATVLSVDPLGDLTGSRHELRIDQLELTGSWISAERLYLGIIYCWLIGAALYGTHHMLKLRRLDRRRQRHIRSLEAANLELAAEKDRFRKLSTIDALTNTFNRYGIELILSSVDLRGAGVSLVLVDIDHFKAINDTRGHDAGDRVLRELSGLLLDHTRADGKVGRWGGEEFILICPGTHAPAASQLAERLRTQVAQTVFEPERPLHVTASFGVAELHDDETFTQAIKRADLALYRAKREGRNRVVSAELEADSGT